MKKLLFALSVFLALPMFALAGPMPREVTVSSTANTETVYIGARGLQTRIEYASAYVTITCTEDCTVTFEATNDAAGYYAGVTAAEWDGASHDHYVVPGVSITADETKTIKVSATEFTISDVSVAGTMVVLVEYEE